jgi:hypothetical protein
MVYGGKRNALEAAKAYRNRLISKVQALTRQERCSIMKKNNRSGLSGVTRSDVMEKAHGRIYRRRYWLAH